MQTKTSAVNEMRGFEILATYQFNPFLDVHEKMKLQLEYLLNGTPTEYKNSFLNKFDLDQIHDLKSYQKTIQLITTNKIKL